jgi:hypothetical protein
LFFVKGCVGYQLSGQINSAQLRLYVLTSSNTILLVNGEGLECVQENLFMRDKTVQNVNLDGNSIKQLPFDFFRGLTNLRTVSMSSNSLTSLPFNLFRGHTNLQIVDLSYNKFVSLNEPRIFIGLTNLKTISFFRNSISYIDEGLFAGLTALQSLNIGANKLTSFDYPNMFTGLSLLRTVTLKMNYISIIPSTTFKSLTLTLLDLQFNPIRHLVDITSNNVELRSTATMTTIDYGCIGSTLSDDPTSLPYTQGHGLVAGDIFFSIFQTDLYCVKPLIFEGIASLKTVTIELNYYLTSLPEDLFKGITSLELVNFYANSLTSIPDKLFQGHTKLKSIFLHYNRLTALNINHFAGLTSLNFIFLEVNLMSSVPSNLFSGLTLAKSIYFYLNPLAAMSGVTSVLEANLEASCSCAMTIFYGNLFN